MIYYSKHTCVDHLHPFIHPSISLAQLRPHTKRGIPLFPSRSCLPRNQHQHRRRPSSVQPDWQLPKPDSAVIPLHLPQLLVIRRNPLRRLGNPRNKATRKQDASLIDYCIAGSSGIMGTSRLVIVSRSVPLAWGCEVPGCSQLLPYNAASQEEAQQEEERGTSADPHSPPPRPSQRSRATSLPTRTKRNIGNSEPRTPGSRQKSYLPKADTST